MVDSEHSVEDYCFPCMTQTLTDQQTAKYVNITTPHESDSAAGSAGPSAHASRSAGPSARDAAAKPLIRPPALVGASKAKELYPEKRGKFPLPADHAYLVSDGKIVSPLLTGAEQGIWKSDEIPTTVADLFDMEPSGQADGPTKESKVKWRRYAFLPNAEHPGYGDWENVNFHATSPSSVAARRCRSSTTKAAVTSR